MGARAGTLAPDSAAAEPARPRRLVSSTLHLPSPCPPARPGAPRPQVCKPARALNSGHPRDCRPTVRQPRLHLRAGIGERAEWPKRVQKSATPRGLTARGRGVKSRSGNKACRPNQQRGLAAPLSAQLANKVLERPASGKASRMAISTACSPALPKKASTSDISTWTVRSSAARNPIFFFKTSRSSAPETVSNAANPFKAFRALAG